MKYNYSGVPMKTAKYGKNFLLKERQESRK